MIQSRQRRNEEVDFLEENLTTSKKSEVMKLFSFVYAGKIRLTPSVKF
jgi:hypothetical protein